MGANFERPEMTSERGLGVVGLEPTETEVEGFTVSQNSKHNYNSQYIPTEHREKIGKAVL
jgi:hypothetical protein